MWNYREGAPKPASSPPQVARMDASARRSTATRTATRSASAAGPEATELRLFAHDLARGLVEAHAEEGRVAQSAVGRPFLERDLRHELGLHPRRGARDPLLGREGRGLAHERSEPLGEIAERHAREARTHLARVPQAVVLEVADEQRPEVGP